MNKAPYEAQKIVGGGGDVVSQDGKTSWFYSEIVKDHFFHPRNFLDSEPKNGEFNASGRAGSPACGDEMRMWLFIDPETERIKTCRWRTFGCGSAIAATSMASVLVTEGDGMTLEEARSLRPQDVMEHLGGLPARKFHCSVLCDKALRDAINDYLFKSNQGSRVILEASRVIDYSARVTDRDIEDAVKDGCLTLAQVVERTKVGIGNKSVIPEVESLIRFYKEKYFG
ncbi:MAG: iron-sulfur cluster assembly scaffold protein [Patescibacteria group bacterium]|jgi:NifU-like protein involved in Fe-S cluster formation